MNIMFYSTSDSFLNYHRRREIEAISRKIGDDGTLLYFTRPRFILAKPRKEESSELVNVKSLLTLLPLSVAFKNSYLLFFFVRLPILLQIFLYKKKYEIADGELFHWFYKPDQLLYLPKSKLIYLHYDNYKGDENYFFSKRSDFDLTLKKCIENSIMSLFCSERLLTELCLKERQNVYYYPNAIDRALLPTVHPNFERLDKQIRVGFIGQIDDSFDHEILESLAKAYPTFDFILIGPVQNKQAQEVIEFYPNIISLGFVKYENLAAHIESFNIGICPYKFEYFNAYRNPLKVYEFFSYGIPVICSECDIDKVTKPYLSIVKDRESFVKALSYELENDSMNKQHWRLNFSNNNCWDNRAEFVVNALRGCDD